MGSIGEVGPVCVSYIRYPEEREILLKRYGLTIVNKDFGLKAKTGLLFCIRYPATRKLRTSGFWFVRNQTIRLQQAQNQHKLIGSVMRFTNRLKAELLSTDRSFIHQTTLCTGKYSHALVEASFCLGAR